ncbi:hypothetical protein ACHAXT_005697 [Thalassiosira profunda]
MADDDTQTSASSTDGAPWSDEEDDGAFEDAEDGQPPSSADRIAQLELEIDARGEEIGRLRAAAIEEEGKDVASASAEEGEEEEEVAAAPDDGEGAVVEKDTTDDDGDHKDIPAPGDVEEPTESANHTDELRKRLGDLTELWEQSLANNRGKRSALAEVADEESTATLPTDIDTSDQNDMSVVSNDPAPPNPKAQSPRWNIFGRRAEAAKAQDLEQAVKDRDEKIVEQEEIISSNIEIIEQMTGTLERMADAIASPEKIAELQMALLGQINEEQVAASSRAERRANRLASVAEGNDTNLKSEISNLQDSVTDLESTVHLQKKAQDTLKSELVMLQGAVDEGIDLNSHQEDKIEALKSELMRLELKNSHLDYDRRQMEEGMAHKVKNRDQTISHLQETHEAKVNDLTKCNSRQEDEIEHLKAELTKLQLRYDLMKKEKEEFEEEMNAKMEEMNLKVELADLEGLGHDISQTM